jgi:hypothetical protein
MFLILQLTHQNTVKPGYNDIGLRDTSSIASDLLWYQLIPHSYRNITLLGYNNTRL